MERKAILELVIVISVPALIAILALMVCFAETDPNVRLLAIGIMLSAFLGAYNEFKLLRLPQKDRQNAIGQVNYVLTDFASSWETLQKKEKVNLQHNSIPVLQKGESIKTIVTDVPSKLPDSYVGEALDIANQLIRLKGEVERDVHSGVITRSVFYKKDEIDELAKRAKECALKMGGKVQ